MAARPPALASSSVSKSLPEPPLLCPRDLGRKWSQYLFVDWGSPLEKRWQERQFLLNVRRQVEKIHDLRHAEVTTGPEQFCLKSFCPGFPFAPVFRSF